MTEADAPTIAPPRAKTAPRGLPHQVLGLFTTYNPGTSDSMSGGLLLHGIPRTLKSRATNTLQ